MENHCISSPNLFKNYCDSIKGIGPHRAVQLIQQHKCGFGGMSEVPALFHFENPINDFNRTESSSSENMSITKNAKFITRLPVELWIRVLEYGTAQELASLRQSCRALRDILPVEEILLEQREFDILVIFYPNSDVLRGHMERDGSQDVINALLEGFDDDNDRVEKFVIDFLELHAGKDPFDASVMENMLMEEACQGDHRPVVQLLLRDPRVSVPQDCTVSLFTEAYFFNEENFLEIFLNDPRVDPSVENNAMLMGAIESTDADMIRTLVNDQRVDPSAHNNQAIAVAAGSIDFPLVCHLMADRRVDPSANENMALVNAVKTGCLAIVDLLLQDSRVDPSADYNKPLRVACTDGRMNIVERLLADSRVNPAANQNAAFIDACTNRHLPIVKRLMQDGRVDPSDNSNQAAVNAYLKGDVELLDLLQRDPRTERSHWVNEAIIEATEFGYVDKVAELLQHPNADPSSRSSAALNYASCNGYLDIVELLLQDPRVDPSRCDLDALRYVERMTNRPPMEIPKHKPIKRPRET